VSRILRTFLKSRARVSSLRRHWSYGLAINPKLYLLRRKRRGDALHEAKEDLLVVILACWSIFGGGRVFLGFP
jgi:hypothetical protein